MVSDSLRYINAIVGFCNCLESWPAPLADLGYVACGVERDIKVLLDSDIRDLKIDLICASPVLDHALCTETKSKTVDPVQAKKYSILTPSNLRDTANLPSAVNLTQLGHEVIYVASRANAEIVADALSTVPVVIPVLGVDDSEFKLFRGSVSRQELHDLLAEGIPITVAPEAWPLSFVPFIAQSPESDIVPSVAQSLSYFIIRGEDFGIEEFAKQALPTWTWYGERERTDLRRVFSRLIDNGRRQELADYYDRVGQPQEWTVKKGQLTKVAQLETLQALMEGFVFRIENEKVTQKLLPEPF